MKQHESDLQIACVQWFKAQYPNLLMWHTPNGGSRNIREAYRLKKMGTLAGVSDIFIAEPTKKYNGLFIEMKHGKGRATTSQREFQLKVMKRGYHAETCKSVNEFRDCCIEYFKT